MQASNKMTLREPTSMDECVYFTNRTLNEGKGKIKAWVFRDMCTKCNKGLMGKPKDPKTGRPKIRAHEYACPECNNTMPEEEYENTLTMNIQYTCSYCLNSGELQAPYQRKKIQRLNEETLKKETVDAVRFQCSKCGKNIDVTKKMK